jgi:Flp pilus assembly CpaE family ATPase
MWLAFFLRRVLLKLDNKKLKVLLNQAEMGSEISESEIESLLEHPVAAYLPCNAGPVTFSINTGAPIVSTEPNQPISVVLDKLAELCFCRWDDTQRKPEPTKAKGKGLLGGSRFSQKLSLKSS